MGVITNAASRHCSSSATTVSGSITIAQLCKMDPFDLAECIQDTLGPEAGSTPAEFIRKTGMRGTDFLSLKVEDIEVLSPGLPHATERLLLLQQQGGAGAIHRRIVPRTRTRSKVPRIDTLFPEIKNDFEESLSMHATSTAADTCTETGVGSALNCPDQSDEEEDPAGSMPGSWIMVSITNDDVDDHKEDQDQKQFEGQGQEDEDVDKEESEEEEGVYVDAEELQTGNVVLVVAAYNDSNSVTEQSTGLDTKAFVHDNVTATLMESEPMHDIDDQDEQEDGDQPHSEADADDVVDGESVASGLEHLSRTKAAGPGLSSYGSSKSSTIIQGTDLDVSRRRNLNDVGGPGSASKDEEDQLQEPEDTTVHQPPSDRLSVGEYPESESEFQAESVAVVVTQGVNVSSSLPAKASDFRSSPAHEAQYSTSAMQPEELLHRDEASVFDLHDNDVDAASSSDLDPTHDIDDQSKETVDGEQQQPDSEFDEDNATSSMLRDTRTASVAQGIEYRPNEAPIPSHVSLGSPVEHSGSLHTSEFPFQVQDGVDADRDPGEELMPSQILELEQTRSSSNSNPNSWTMSKDKAKPATDNDIHSLGAPDHGLGSDLLGSGPSGQGAEPSANPLEFAGSDSKMMNSTDDSEDDDESLPRRRQKSISPAKPKNFEADLVEESAQISVDEDEEQISENGDGYKDEDHPARPPSPTLRTHQLQQDQRIHRRTASDSLADSAPDEAINASSDGKRTVPLAVSGHDTEAPDRDADSLHDEAGTDASPRKSPPSTNAESMSQNITKSEHRFAEHLRADHPASETYVVNSELYGSTVEIHSTFAEYQQLDAGSSIHNDDAEDIYTDSESESVPSSPALSSGTHSSLNASVTEPISPAVAFFPTPPRVDLNLPAKNAEEAYTFSMTESSFHESHHPTVSNAFFDGPGRVDAVKIRDFARETPPSGEIIHDDSLDDSEEEDLGKTPPVLSDLMFPDTSLAEELAGILSPSYSEQAPRNDEPRPRTSNGRAVDGTRSSHYRVRTLYPRTETENYSRRSKSVRFSKPLTSRFVEKAIQTDSYSKDTLAVAQSKRKIRQLENELARLKKTGSRRKARVNSPFRGLFSSSESGPREPSEHPSNLLRDDDFSDAGGVLTSPVHLTSSSFSSLTSMFMK